MAQINSPGKILKLWHKIQDRFGVDVSDKDALKKAGEKDKAAARQNVKITKGLTVLKAVTKAGVKTPSQAKRFEATRDRVTLVMKKYCKTIKTARLEGAQDMSKLRKAVKQLTVIVAALSVLLVTNDEDDADINVLRDVDTSSLDKAMEDPNFAAGDDGFTFDETPALPADTVKPPTSTDDADVLKRARTLATRLGRAADPARVKEMKLLLSAAHTFARKKDHALAHRALDRAEQVLAPRPRPALADADGALSLWQAARAKAVGQLRQLSAAIARSGYPDARAALILVNALMKNLTVSPGTAQSILELERYLQTDAIIREAETPNSWGVTVELQGPLLQALQPLKQALGA